VRVALRGPGQRLDERVERTRGQESCEMETDSLICLK
jgi:hypothetical protein